MDYSKAIHRVFDSLEGDNLENAVMGCLRIARNLNDYVSAAYFLREMHPENREAMRIIYDDASHLKNKALKYIAETSLNRWLETHTVEFISSEKGNDAPNVLQVAAGEIDADLQQCELAIADLVVPAGLGPFDAAAFSDSVMRQKANIRVRIRALQSIKSKIKARCLNYVIQIERQIEAQGKSRSFMESVQNDVNNYFKTRSDDVYAKLAKASQLVSSQDLEDTSLLLTEVRRALKSVADYYLPPSNENITCVDGKTRVLGDEQYLNRLHEFIARTINKSTSRELLKEELEQLIVYVRRLNDIASKGVHAEVTLSEAKQGLIGLYFFLFNLTQHLERVEKVAQEPK